MADGSHDHSHFVTTAVKLQAPTFPYPTVNSSESTLGPDVKPSARPDSTGKREPEESGQHETAEAHRGPNRRLSRAQTDVATDRRPPILQKTQTDLSCPQARPLSLGKKRAKESDKKPKIRRHATLTFHSDSSDSSSSESEDTTPTGVDSEKERGRRTKARRRSSGGPSLGFRIAHQEFHTKGRVSKREGRLRLHINETVNRGYFAKTLGAGLRKHLRHCDAEDEKEDAWKDIEGRKIPPEADDMEDPHLRVRLNIVIIVIGSRGDIQPFVRIGKILRDDYGHRVRIATHPAFKAFIEDEAGLEFFSVGGDPSELMAFMVKNPGLIPSIDTIKEGEIGRRRAAMYEMFQGMWRACINSTDDEHDLANIKMMGSKNPFVADAIIANPPSFAPPHIAERLGIPLHMMFTFPYSPTVQFPHPLANIKASNVDANYTNFMSYPLVEMMTWQGLGDLINRFRAKTLRLDAVSTLWAPGQLYRLKVPYTYMWSPGLVPKPKDWGPEIDIAGFVFLDLASCFKPPPDLQKFLDAGEPPVYIGFGSIVVDDPDKFTALIFEAVKLAGVRALVNKGWGGFGGKSQAPDNVFMLDNTPHDWLFPRVSAVIHHGGAGTTAIGLKCAKPTMIIPFFGDQPFWGAMVSKAKAGAHECIPYKDLTAEKFAEGIKQCLTDEARKNVQEIADSIAAEGDGALNAVRSFHRSLPLKGENSMRCHMLPHRCAAWQLKNTNLRLSPLAADVLVGWKKIKWNDLRLLRVTEWNDFGGPGEPVTGVLHSLLGTADDVLTGIGLAPVKMAKSIGKREKYYKKKMIIKRRDRHARDEVAKPIGGTNSDADNKSSLSTTKPDTTRPNSIFTRQHSTLSTLSTPPDLAPELSLAITHGLKKSALALLRSPMYFFLALTQGFHNAPRLYGDETVRRPHRITGFHSGLKAGRDEFVYGIRDGVSGLWMHPARGARRGGVIGAVKGVGMGVGGFVLKDVAALVGPCAYFMKGVNEEAGKGNGPTGYLRRARICQGGNERAELSDIKAARGEEGSESVTGAQTEAGDANQIEAGDESTAAAQAQAQAQARSESNTMTRQDVELEVSRMWEQVKAQVAREKRQNKSGVRAALLGSEKSKDGRAVERKRKAAFEAGWVADADKD